MVTINIAGLGERIATKVTHRLNRNYTQLISKMIPESPVRVNSFPPFGGLYFMTICPNIMPSKKRSTKLKQGKIMNDN